MTNAEKIARQMASERGHRNPEAEITLVGGAKVPAWALYMEDAMRRATETPDPNAPAEHALIEIASE